MATLQVRGYSKTFIKFNENLKKSNNIKKNVSNDFSKSTVF